MKTIEKMTRTIAGKAQNAAENNAVQTSRYLCRLWLGVEKVPKVLLEKDAK